MSQLDDAKTLELLDLEADGCLPDADRPRLEAALDAAPELRRELDEMRSLQRSLAASRVAVSDDFRDQVMRALPVAAWEPTGRRGWGLAAGAAAFLAVLSALLFGVAGAGADGPIVGVAGAIGEAMVASLLTGAGLLGASWRGLGLALGELLAVSPVSTAAFGVVVLAVNVLFFRLLRRDVRAPEWSGGERGSQRR